MRAARLRPAHYGAPLAWLLVAVVSACVGRLTWGLVEHSGLRELSAAAQRKVDLYYSELEGRLGKFEYLPGLLRLDPEVRELLQTLDPHLAARVSQRLAWVNEQAQATAITLLTTQGAVAASSHPEDAPRNRAFHPVFQEALHKGQGRYHAVDSVLGMPGYAFAHEIVEDGRVIGVCMVEADLGVVERNWWPGTDRALAYDEHGIVILSSTREWRYRSLAPLSEVTRERLRHTRQFSDREILPLGLEQVEAFDNGGRLVRLPVVSGRGEQRQSFVMHSLTMPRTGWTVVLLSDTQAVRGLARQAGMAAGLAAALLGALLLYWRVQRQVLVQKAAARELLERANAELEERVASRTAALAALNEELQREVQERRLAEQRLLSTQDELVQAGKLATLGQMAAGLAHELNQPLHALRTRASNASQLLALGRAEDAQRNIANVIELADRMGRTTAQLRSFAHRAVAGGQAVSLRRCVDLVLDLLRERIERHGVTVEVQVDAALRVRASSSSRCWSTWWPMRWMPWPGGPSAASRWPPVATASGSRCR
jgi:C4-dicarboxylate-specific signal transduction histidine kinase